MSDFRVPPKFDQRKVRMSGFIKGLDLCESFFTEIAKPILARAFPSLCYSAGLIGDGSDVLGFDDLISTDHAWGPRFLLFLPSDEHEATRSRIADIFSAQLPYQYKGYSVHFSPPDERDGGTRVQEDINAGRVDPLIQYHTRTSFFLHYLGWNPTEEVAISQWLTFPEHRLLGLTSGRMFHDELGVDETRRKFTYFPRDVWLWMMASQWKLIAEEEPFIGRCGMVGDDLGSRVVAARQVQRLMRLAFLLEKRYAPYSKWLGTAFDQLASATALSPILQQVLAAGDWQSRGKYLGDAYSLLAKKHNSLNLTKPLDTGTSPFFNRPFPVIHGERFTQALQNAIKDPMLRSLPPIGTVTQLTDSVTVYDNLPIVKKLNVLY